MITFSTRDHVPVLGRLIGGETDARVECSEVGEALVAAWKSLEVEFPQVHLLEYQVMPDHFHGIIFVRGPLPKPLGALVASVKARTASKWKRMLAEHGEPQNGALPSQSDPRAPSSAAPCSARIPTDRLPFWSPGYHDRLLLRHGQLATMRAYVLDNPRRLAVKRAHPDLFRIVRDLSLCGTRYSALGNHFLLNRPDRLVIQCSRRLSEEALAAREAEVLESCRQGAVPISPCISPGEKRIARAVLDARLPLVVLLENGFPPLYKPPRDYFEACSEGRLLLLAPWPYHAERRPITRAQCLALNRLAAELAETGETILLTDAEIFRWKLRKFCGDSEVENGFARYGHP